MNYQETVSWMFQQLPMYQRVGSTAFKKDLTNTIAFCERLENPQNKFKSIHIAGTNGKGSTSHMLASVLQEAGYKVGLYTSPHLKNYTERIRINGIEIEQEFVVDFIDLHKSFLEKQQLSFFEMTVCLAFAYFAFCEVDIAIIEVGLGGRLDSTNVITPELCIITNIGYDHMQFLGDTLPLIASEKAGIIKDGIPVIIGERHPETEEVFINKAKLHKSPIFFAEDDYKNFETDLLGDYQKKNLNTAYQTIKKLEGFLINKDHIKTGFLNVVKNTNLKGRYQVLEENPKIICDTAHNQEGLIQVSQQLQTENYDNLHFVLGVVNDKQLGDILTLFPKDATYYFCKPNVPRGLSETELQKKAKHYKLEGEVFSSVKKALMQAKTNARENDLIYVGGSTFVVAEVV